MHQQNKSSESKVKFRQVRNHGKTHFETGRLAYANKIKESVTSQKLGSWDFRQTANNGVFSKEKTAKSSLFNDMNFLSSASNKAKLLVKSFSKNFNLDESGISLSIFSF